MFKQPLNMVRVLDLAQGWPAYTGRVLGDLGAEVIKIEPPAGDPLRGTPDFERLNANKYGCTLDMSTDGRDARNAWLNSPTSSSHSPEAVDFDALSAAKGSLIVVSLPANAGVESVDRRRCRRRRRALGPPPHRREAAASTSPRRQGDMNASRRASRSASRSRRSAANSSSPASPLAPQRVRDAHPPPRPRARRAQRVCACAICSVSGRRGARRSVEAPITLPIANVTAAAAAPSATCRAPL